MRLLETALPEKEQTSIDVHSCVSTSPRVVQKPRDLGVIALTCISQLPLHSPTCPMPTSPILGAAWLAKVLSTIEFMLLCRQILNAPLSAMSTEQPESEQQLVAALKGRTLHC